MKKIHVLLLLGILSAGIIGCRSAASENAQTGELPAQISALAMSPSDSGETNSILVTSSEKITVVPDIAEVVYSVRTKAKDAADCQQQNSAAVSQVVELLKSLGVAKNSIQTSDYYMNPVYDYSSNTARLTGYEAIATLTVSNLPIDGLEEILAQSVLNGINTISSITYQASKYDESYQAALTAAVKTAFQKAEVLANAAGCSVGKVLNIQETSGYSPARYSDYALTNQYRAAKEESLSVLADSAGIMPGEIQVEASVVVEYQLN